MDDFFRIIKGYPGYRVSRDGEVQSRWSRTVHKTLTQTWLPLKPVRSGRYWAVNLSDGVKKTQHLIHRLVLHAFVGPCPEGLICCHNDGNPTNNRVENLRWDTYQSNSDDMLIHGTRLMGSQLNAKLTEAEVGEIRRLRAEGKRIAVLAQEFGVAPQNVEAIFQRRTWRHVA
jgi:HNH endonuclease